MPPKGSGPAEALRDEPLDLPVSNRTVAFEGRIFSVVQESFDYGGTQLMREFVVHPGAVAVLAVDGEGRVLLIKQYRHPIRARVWEIPAGLLDVSGEPPLAAAQRELAEEVDLEADEWQELVTIATTPGGNNEQVVIYLATGLTATAESYHRSEEEADIELRWVPLDEAVAAVLAGELHNAILVVAVLAAAGGRLARQSARTR